MLRLINTKQTGIYREKHFNAYLSDGKCFIQNEISLHFVYEA